MPFVAGAAVGPLHEGRLWVPVKQILLNHIIHLHGANLEDEGFRTCPPPATGHLGPRPLPHSKQPFSLLNDFFSPQKSRFFARSPLFFATFHVHFFDSKSTGVKLATNRMRGGSDSPLDSTPQLDGQNTAAECMVGGSIISGQRNFNLVRVRLDLWRTMAAAFVQIRKVIHITHKVDTNGFLLDMDRYCCKMQSTYK